MAHIPFHLAANVQHDLACFLQSGNFGGQSVIHLASDHVGCDHAAQDNGILCGRIGGSISQVEVFEIENGQAGVDSGCQNVDTLVNTLAANALSAEDAAVLLSYGELEDHGHSVGIVGSVAEAGNVYALEIPAKISCLACIQTGACCGELANLDDSGAENALEQELAACCVAACCTALLVCAACQRNADLLAGNQVEGLNHVACGIDVGIGGAHGSVGPYAAGLADSEAGLDCQLGAGAYACSHDDHVGGDRGAVCEDYAVSLVAAGDLGNGCAGENGDAHRLKVADDNVGELLVHVGHNLGQTLDKSNLDALLAEVLCRLETDEAAANYDCGLGADFQLGNDAVSIGNGEYVVNAILFDALDGGHDGAAAGGENELVISFGNFAVGSAYGDGLVLCVNVDNFVVDANVNVETLLEHLGGNEEQLIAVFDNAADIIGQAAVCERNVIAFFEEDDFGILVGAASLGGCRSTGSNAANYKNSHYVLSPIDVIIRYPAGTQRWYGLPSQQRLRTLRRDRRSASKLRSQRGW